MNFAKRRKELREIVKKIRSGDFDYDNREKPKTNWSLYDQAQIQELSSYLENTKDIVDEAYRRIKERTPHNKRGPGRPPTDPADITKVLLLQGYTNSPNRVAEGLLDLFREKIGIRSHFSYKTIERGYDRAAVNDILDEVVKITNETVEGEEDIFSTDGTGYSASNKVNYAAKRQEQNSKKGKKKGKQAKESENMPPEDSFPESKGKSNKSFTYSVMSVGTKYKLIAGMEMSPDHSVGETTMFPEVFQQTKSLHPDMKEMLGDGIYSARWLVDLVSRNDVKPYFLPKSNVTFRSKGFSGWWDMVFPLLEDPQDWMRHYHMRSISETVNSMIECRFGYPLRKRLDPRKETETRLKLVGHNIRRVAYIQIIEGIALPWSNKGG